MVDRASRVPAWAWLAAIVTGSVVFRAWLGSRMPAPFIFTDELQYQENARSLAAGAGIQVRDEAARGAMSAAALDHVRREHELERTAELYVAALEQALGGDAVSDAVLGDVARAAADVGIGPGSAEATELAQRLAEVELGR